MINNMAIKKIVKKGSKKVAKKGKVVPTHAFFRDSKVQLYFCK